MKKVLLILAGAFSMSGFAQTILLTNMSNSTALAPNDTIYLTTQIETDGHVLVDITNTGNTQNIYKVKREDVLLNGTAYAYFCFGGGCFTDNVLISPDGDTLNPGQSATEIPGSFNALTAYLMESSTVGKSIVRYTVFNVNDANDKVIFTVKYNYPVPVYVTNPVVSFSGVTNSSGQLDPSAAPSAMGMTIGSFSATGTSANSSSPGVFSFSGWPAGATHGNDTPGAMSGSINTGVYYSITVTPKSGYYVSLYSVAFDVSRSDDGIRNYAVRSSKDSYAANLPGIINSNVNLSVLPTNTFFWNSDATTGSQSGSKTDLSGDSFSNLTNPVTFRFYGWNSESANGTFGIDNVMFEGVSSMAVLGIGTVSHNLNSSIKVYPNPSASGRIYVDASIDYSKIVVISSTGQVVASETTEGQAGKAAELNLNTLAAGIYYVQLYSKKGIATEKLVISGE